MIDSSVLSGKLFSCHSNPETSVIKNAAAARLFVLARRQVLVIPVCVLLARALSDRAMKGDVSQGHDAFSSDVRILVCL